MGIFGQTSTERKVRTFSLSPAFLDGFRGKQPAWGPLGYVTYVRTYSRIKPDGTNEEFWETCQRVVEGTFNIQKIHCRNLNLPWNEPKAQNSAQEMFRRMWEFKFLPPGRGLWMMGTDLVYEKGGACLNNCAFSSTSNIDTEFADPFCFLMDMSMLGVGVGGDTKGKGKAKLATPKLTDEPFVVEDSREGWVDLIRTILNSFAGKGQYPAKIDYSKVRGRGQPIKGFGGVASGAGPLHQLVQHLTTLLLPEGVQANQTVQDKLPDDETRMGTVETQFLGEGQPYKITSTHIVDIFNYIGKCVVAGGVRRTAEIMFGDADDGDFVTLKQDKEALYDRRWASNNSILGTLGMDYTEVADSIAVNGEPGIIWLDNMKAFSRMGYPADNKDRRALGSNPCVTGDTLVFTSEGPKRADADLGKPFEAIVDGHAYPCQTGMFQTGTKPVYLLQTKEGHSIKVTADHKILTAPKVTAKKRYELWVEAQDLVEGDCVILNDVRATKEWGGHGTFDQGWLLGNLLGDGHFHKAQATCKLQFWGPHKEALLDLALQRIASLGGEDHYHEMRTGTEVESRDMLSTGSRRLLALAAKFGIDTDKNIGTDDVLLASSAFQSGFLRGFFDADGSVQGAQEKGVSIRLGLVNRQHLSLVQRMLLNFGINSTVYENRKEAGDRLLPDGKGGEALYPCQASHELVIANDNVAVFADRIGFDEPSRKEKLATALQAYKRALNRDRFVATFTSLTYLGVEPVYDCTVDDVHRFGANGITVHNCSEQTLEDQELCCLVETYPAHHDSFEDYQRTLKMAYLYAKTVTLVPTHNPKTNAVMGRNRRIGASQSGIVQAINKLGRRQYLDWCDNGYTYIRALDKQYADWLCVPRSLKVTSVKPSGCLTHDTVIRTTEGDKSFLDIFAANGIDLGDKYGEYREWYPLKVPTTVLDMNGDERAITKLFINGVEETIRLHLEDGTVVECTPDHKFLLTDGNWKSARDLTENDDLAVK